MPLHPFYEKRNVLVTGADRPLGQVLVREIVRGVFPGLSKLYLAVGEQVTDAGSALDGAPADRARLRGYASSPVFEPLYRDSSLDWFADYLAQKTEVVKSSPASGAHLGMSDTDATRLQRDVTLILHGDGLADPCDVRRDPDDLHRSGMSVAGFAAKCPPDTVLVIPGSLFAIAAGRRFRSAPLEFMPRVPEEPATGMRASDGSGDGMPSRLVAAQGLVESSLSNLAAQGATARLAVVRHGVVGPPLRDPPDGVMYGGFDGLAFAVGVGAATQMRASKKSLVEMVPADLLAERLIAAPLALSASRDNQVSVAHASTTEAHPLSLGMAAQYLTEYYARNCKALAVSLDYGVPSPTGEARIRVPLSPVLAQSPRLALGGWGRVGLPFCKQRGHLALHPHAAAASRYREASRSAADMVKVLDKGVQGSQFVFSTSCTKVPCGTDIREVEWELYCKAVARNSFLHLCRTLGVEAPQAPPALKYCEMDTLTASPGMSFSTPLSLIQRFFPDIHFLTTCVQQPDGHAVRYAPGLTPARRDTILNLPSVRAAIDLQAKEENVEREAIVARAHAILDRVGDRLNVNMVRMLGIGLRKVMQTIYANVHTNKSAYEFVRRSYLGIGSLRPVGRRALVLIPSHRSYMDFLVVSYLMYMWGLPVPHICAGEDFLRLAFVSTMLRGSGAFFMRRSFKGDQLYGTLFREYTRLLATDGRAIEFFIEGSRSRMGKTLAPKVGILKIMVESLLEAVMSGDTGFVDVVFIPVSLSYDKILEGGLYTRELTGGKKPPETVSNLISAASVLKNKFGTLNVTVGKPISLSEYILKGEQGGRTPDPVIPKPVALLKDVPGRRPEPEGDATQVQADAIYEKVSGMSPEDNKQLLNQLAWRITADLQSGLIVTPSALLAAVLLYLHTPTELLQGLHVDDVVGEMTWLREQVLKSGGHMKPDTKRQSGEQLFNYAANLLSPYVAVSALSVVSIPDNDALLLLAIYSNQLVHLFCDRAVLATVCTSLPRATLPAGSSEQSVFSVSADAASQRCAAVKDLLSMEFPNYRQPPLGHDAWMAGTTRALCTHEGAAVNGPHLTLPRDTMSMMFLTNMLYILFDSYWLVAAGLAYLKGESKVLEAQFLDKLGSAVEPLLEEEVLQFRTTVNREVLRNALAKLKELGYVTRGPNAAQGIALAPHLAAGNAEALYACIADVNELRWKPTPDLRGSVSQVVSFMQSARL